MEFFDQKQDVLDVQLTQHGRYLLSKGKFKPHFYSFYDNNIIYDSNYAGHPEPQNASEDRIKNETPYFKTQYSFSSSEKRIRETNEIIKANQTQDIHDSEAIQTSVEREYVLSEPIGTNDFNSKHIPAWTINFLAGKITGSYSSVNIRENKGGNNIIFSPQINSDIEIDLTQYTFNQPPAKYSIIKEEMQELYNNLIRASLVHIGEENSIDQRYNFDIEVFKIEEENDDSGKPTGKEILIPLHFGLDNINLNVGNEVDLKKLEIEKEIISVNESDLDEGYVEHYFKILVDNEIDRDVLCELVPPSNNKSTNVFVDAESDNQYCADKDAKQPQHNIYDGTYDDSSEACE